MKLKSIDGKVPYIMAAGKDFVKDEMSLAAVTLYQMPPRKGMT